MYAAAGNSSIDNYSTVWSAFDHCIQVKYWLNIVSLRCSSFNRLLLIGTKIDLVSEDLDDYLARLRCNTRLYQSRKTSSHFKIINTFMFQS